MNGGPDNGIRPFQAAYWYFSIVFTILFLLEPVRVLWLVPQWGEQGAMGAEMGLLLVGTIVTARWVVSRLSLPATVGRRLTVGLFAFGMIALSEILVSFWFLHISPQDFMAEHHASYYLGIGLFTAMPVMAGPGRST